MSAIELSTPALLEVERIHTFFPILRLLGNRWAVRRPWDGQTICVCAHLTTLTAALLREMALGGAEIVVSAANPATTDARAVALLEREVRAVDRAVLVDVANGVTDATLVAGGGDDLEDLATTLVADVNLAVEVFAEG